MPMEERKLLLIEDNPFLTEWLQRLQADHFANVGMTIIRSELEFLIGRQRLAESGFHGIILDWMLAWKGYVEIDSTEFPNPRGDHFDAGKRIMEDIYGTPRLATLPLLIYSANDLSVLDLSKARRPQTIYMRKDQPDSELIQWVKRLS